MKNKKILVTGSSGFIGGHVADALEKSGFKVVLFDSISSEYKTNNQQEIIGDILNPEDVGNAIRGCHAVYHFAGQADIGISSREPAKTILTNVIGTQNVLEAARNNNVKRIK